MNSNNLNKKIGMAAKWSIATEIAAKLISPVSNMILARFLTPEAFGVVATVTMVTSFADMFTDAGFQKYLVQHEFKDKNDQYDSTTVAFWTNLAISTFFMVRADFDKKWVGKDGRKSNSWKCNCGSLLFFTPDIILEYSNGLI